MRFAAIIFALLLSAPTMAHQLKASVTTVLFNKRTNNIELMHRFYLHDTEHAVEHLFDGNADILSNKEDQKRFADYVESHIALQTLEASHLSLKKWVRKLMVNSFGFIKKSRSLKEFMGFV